MTDKEKRVEEQVSKSRLERRSEKAEQEQKAGGLMGRNRTGHTL